MSGKDFGVGISCSVSRATCLVAAEIGGSVKVIRGSRGSRVLRVLIVYLLPCEDVTVWIRVPRLGSLGGAGRGKLLLESGTLVGGCRGVRGGVSN